MPYLILAATLAGCTVVLLSVLIPHLHRQRQITAALDTWRATAADQRISVFTDRCASDPRSAANWFLLACAHLQRDDVTAAARYFGKAHHADWRLESAALMTFACLKASAANNASPTLADHMRITWREMGQPTLGRRKGERVLLAGLASSNHARPITNADELQQALIPAP